MELHGWIVVRESYSEEGDSDTLLKKIISQLNEKIDLLKSEGRNIEINLFSRNGVKQVSFFGAPNHKGDNWEWVIKLAEWIAKEAIGSYGIIYMFDDEDKNGLDNQFQVLVLKKGVISFELDTFLSPFIPEVEE